MHATCARPEKRGGSRSVLLCEPSMEHWKNLTSSVGPLGQKLTERFGALNQQAREHFGQTNDITELPDEYRELEDRVDALKNAQNVLIRAARAYEHEGYDYPHQLQESVTHGAQTLSHTLSAWAATATKNTSLPSVQPTNAPPTEPRTLHHALSRSAASAAIHLGNAPATAVAQPGGEPVPTNESRLGELLQQFAVAQDKIGSARLLQDKTIIQSFVNVWNAFGAQIQLAMKYVPPLTQSPSVGQGGASAPRLVACDAQDGRDVERVERQARAVWHRGRARRGQAGERDGGGNQPHEDGAGQPRACQEPRGVCQGTARLPPRGGELARAARRRHGWRRDQGRVRVPCVALVVMYPNHFLTIDQARSLD